MRFITLTLSLFLLMSLSAICQKINMAESMGINFLLEDSIYKYTRMYTYKNSTKEIMSEVIAMFGDDYEKHHGDIYYWHDVKVKQLCNRTLNIKVFYRRYDFRPEPVGDIKTQDIVEIAVMSKNYKRDYLHELKFWNILKVRRMFKKLSEII